MVEEGGDGWLGDWCQAGGGVLRPGGGCVDGGLWYAHGRVEARLEDWLVIRNGVEA